MKHTKLRITYVGIVAAVALGGWGWGCASQSAFDRFLGANRYQEAALAFQQDSTLWNDPGALLAAGQLFANLALPVRDFGLARRALERLVTTFSRTSEAGQAAIVLALLTQMESDERELAALTTELDNRVVQADTLVASRKAAEAEIQALRRRVERLEADLEEARHELERLKAIDLRRPAVRR